MEIIYRNNKIYKVCTDSSKAEKQYGLEMANKITMRLNQLKAAKDIDYLMQYHIGRCHLLIGNRKTEYAMDLVHPYRLIFCVDKDNNIQIVEIIEIVDYH